SASDVRPRDRQTGWTSGPERDRYDNTGQLRSLVRHSPIVPGVRRLDSGRTPGSRFFPWALIGLQLAVRSSAAHERYDMASTHEHADHTHGEGCGHMSFTHEGHVDYAHDGHFHRPVGEQTYECTKDGHEPHGEHSHEHHKGCGHVAVPHGDHVDYVHDGHRHAAHGDHWDDH
ncbi:hypothetical protein, partial [Streptomyces humidus]|uniref:hypothetical protein n=1 Tax=Streptomyces humidus TaxID=52259 RepID=UPI003328AFDC